LCYNILKLLLTQKQKLTIKRKTNFRILAARLFCWGKLMNEHPYAKYSGDDKREMILRDYLAVDRTIMSNETSFLAYIRTALTLGVVGVTLIKFFEDRSIQIIGWVFCLLGLFLLVHGAVRYQEMDNVLQKLTGKEMLEQDKMQAGGVVRRVLSAGHTVIRMFL
jgi:putative membrane protein